MFNCGITSSVSSTTFDIFKELSHESHGGNFEYVKLQPVVMIDISSISFETSLRWMPLYLNINLGDWCRHLTSLGRNELKFLWL